MLLLGPREKCAVAIRICQANELPHTDFFDYYTPDDGEKMEFRLTYQGPLPPEKWSYSQDFARATDKHRLRKQFHIQLRELWSQHPDLRYFANQKYVFRKGEAFPITGIVPFAENTSVAFTGGAGRSGNQYVGMATSAHILREGDEAKTWLDYIADGHIACNGIRFVPLVSEASGFTCSLDILFLRRDGPGSLIQSHGDIDSRIKVLFDGLKMPKQVGELGDYKRIEEDENPFYCLLENDKLVTNVTVTTDRLLAPKAKEERVDEVLLITHVTVVNPSAIFAGGRRL